MKKVTFSQRIVSTTVIIAMIVNPAIAQQPVPQMTANKQIVVDGSAERTGLKQASNGTSVVDIAAPSAAGVSHNRFTEFNVDQQGVILNNSLNPVLTQLGGWSDGNRRLAGGEASIILNEVTGLSRSNLLGQIEIAGKSAEFVLANPNGISCSGCGFINTPRVTLVTGRPDMVNGALQGFNVSGGDFVLDGKGLNASNIDRVDIITRAAKINAELYARQLNISTGRNYVDYQTGQLAALDNADAKPDFQFALDASSLGAMYANSIQLIGTEKGMGVNSQGLIQSVKDLEISADGDIQLKQVLANNQAVITSHSNSITVNEKLYANKLSLTADQNIANKGLVAASELIELNAQNVTQAGSLYAGLTTEGKLSSDGVLRANIANTLTNSGSVFVGADVDLSARHLDNSEGTLTLNSAESLKVSGELKNHKGTILFNAASATLAANLIDNNEGTIFLAGDGQLRVNAINSLDNSGGVISSHTGLHLTANDILNREGTFASNAITLNAQDIDNTQGFLYGNTLNLHADTFTNNLGEAIADSLDIASRITTNNKGRLQGETISLAGDAYVSEGGIVLAQGTQGDALRLDITSRLENTAAAVIESHSGDLTINTDTVDNHGGTIHLLGDGTLHIDALDFSNQNGLIQADTNLKVTGKDINNNAGVLFAKNLNLTGQTIQNSQGQIVGNRLLLDAPRIENGDGKIIATNDLSLQFDQLGNQAGHIQGQQLALTGKSLDNTKGTLATSDGGQLSLDVNAFINQQGNLISDGDLQVHANKLNNDGGTVDGKTLALTLQQVSNRAGVIQGDELSLSVPELDNAGGIIAALLSGGNGLQLNVTGAINNEAGTLLGKGQAFSLNASTINNQRGQIINTGSGSLILNTNALDNRSGSIKNNTDTLINLTGSTTFDNENGLISAAGNLQVTTAGALGNQSGYLLAGNALSVHSARLDNSAGLISANSVALYAPVINNTGGDIEGNHLALHAGQLNNAGSLLATGSENNALLLDVTQLNNSGRIETYSHDFLLDNINLHSEGGQIIHRGDGELRIRAAGTFDNRQGTLATQGRLVFDTEAIDNRAGQLIAAKQLDMNITALNNQGGLLQSGDGLSLSLDELNNSQGGRIIVGGSSAASITINNTLNNQQGSIIYGGTNLLTLVADNLDNSNQGTIGGSGAIKLDIAQLLNNNGGNIISDSAVNILTSQLDNRTGGFIEAGSLLLVANQVDNHDSQIQAQQFSITADIVNNIGGTILALGQQQSDITTQTLTNTGNILSNQNMLLQTTLLDNQGGSIESKQLTLTTDILDNNAIIRAGELNAQAQTLYNHADGRIDGGQLSLHSPLIENSGLIVAGGAAQAGLDIYADTLINSGRLESQGENLELHILNPLTNTGTVLHRGDGVLSIQTAALENNNGTIVGNKIALDTTTVNNVAGEIYGQTLSTSNVHTIDNRAGLLQADQALTLNATSLDNRDQGVILGGNTANLTVEHLDNRQGTIAGGQFNIDTQALDNRDGEVIVKQFTLHANDLDNSTGTIATTAVDTHSLTIDLANMLDNRGGLIHADGTGTTLTSTQLDNTGGAIEYVGSGNLLINTTQLTNADATISSTHNLTVAATAVDNSDGNLLANNNLDVVADHVINRGGNLMAGQTLKVSASDISNDQSDIHNDWLGIISGNLIELAIGNLDNRAGGRIQGNSVNITSDTVDNRGLLRGGDLLLTATTLNNTQGEISGDNIAITATQLTNTAGWIAGSQVQINAGQLDNIYQPNVLAYISGQHLAIDAGTLNNQSVIQGEDVHLSGTTLDNTNGLILSTAAQGESLTFDFTQGITNNLGHIESRGDSLLINSALDNRNGLVFMAGSGILSLLQVDNTDGELLSNGNLTITTDPDTGTIKNQNGTIQALQDATLAAADIDNHLGQINAGAALAINAQHLDNTQGLLLSTGTADNSLQLTIADELVNAGGVIETHAENLVFSAQNINNQQGEIRHLGSGLLSINRQGDFANDGGTLLTAGDMSIVLDGTLTNSGNLVAARNLQIDAASVTNLSGSLLAATTAIINSATTTNQGRIQADAATFNGQTLNNQAGQLAVNGTAGNALQFNLLSVDNSHAGLIENHSGDLLLDVAINNQGGKLLNLGQGVLRLTAVDNVGGQIYSDGDLVVEQQTLDNSDGGLLQSAGHLILNTQALNNRSGTLYTGNTLKITTESLDNTDGGELLAAEGFDVSVNQTLDNTHGRMVMLAEDMNINAGLLLNNFGELIHNGNGNLILGGGGTLNNNAGRISTQGSLSLTLDSLLNNAATSSTGTPETALISARHFSLTATELQNNGGQIQASEDLSLTLPNINNQGGKILALGTGQNALALQTASFDNSQGGLLQVHSNDLTLSGLLFNNQGGVVNHQGSGTLEITGQQNLLNAGGTLQSSGDIHIDQANIDNRNGLISGQEVKLVAANLFDNSSQGQVAGNKLAITANNLNNTAGGLLAGLGNSADALTFNVGLLNNSGGTLRSGANNWVLNLDTILNNGGSILHTGNDQLKLTSNNQLTTSGTIASTADLVISASGLTNYGILVADKNVELTTGTITNAAAGVIKSGTGLSLISTGSLSNQGQITSGTALAIELSGQLNNSGVIVTNATNTTFTAAGLTNSGTVAHNGSGLVKLATGANLNNTGTLKSAGTLNLDATTINNNGAAIISAANLAANGFSSINNGSNALIEAGNISLQGNSLTNQGTFVVSGSGNSFGLNVQTLNNSGNLASNSTNLGFTGDLINSGAITHAGNGLLSLGDSGSVNIQGGTLSTAGTANLSGTITGTGDLFARLGITINGTGTFNNNGSRLYTQGNLTINSAVNNTQNGSMIADGILTVTTSGTINNASGHLQGSDISLQAGTLTNTDGGEIISTGTGSGSITADTVNNSGGHIQATNTDFSITAHQGGINNTGGSITHTGSGTLLLDAPAITNTAGSTINGNGIIRLLTQGLFTNGGEISSQTLTEIKNLDALTNTGTIGSREGSVDIQVATTLTNTGTLSGKQKVELTAATLANSGAVQSDDTVKLSMTALTAIGNINAGELLDIHVVNSINVGAGETVSTAGSLILRTDGDVANAGTIAAANTLTLGGHSLTNNGSIEGGTIGTSSLDFSAGILNNNKISSANGLNIKAASYTNNGSTAAANNLVLAIKGDITNNSGKAFFSGGGMTLGADGNISNNGGTIFSVGNMILAGENGSSASTAVANTNGRIETLGDLTINTGNLTNTRTGVSYEEGAPTTTVEYSEMEFVKYEGIPNPTYEYEHDPSHYPALVPGYEEQQFSTVTERTLYTPVATGPDAAILSGGNMDINTHAGIILNQYGTIASGNNLTINGGDLHLDAYVTQAHDVITTTRIEHWRNGDGYYCPDLICTRYGLPVVTSQDVILGSAIGTISAVGSITGNLSNKITIQIADVNINPSQQDTNSSGSTGSANRGTSGQATVNNGQAQNTNSQSLGHNGAENGSNANAGGLTAINLQLAQAINGLLVTGNIAGETQEGSEPWQSTGSNAHVLANSTPQAQVGALELAGDLAPGDHTGTGYDAEAARQQAEANASAGVDSTATASLTDAQASSHQGTGGADGSALASGGQRKSNGVATASADGIDVNTAILEDADGITGNSASVATPAPWSISVTPNTPNNLGGLFVYNTAPDSKYLIETRPEFTDYTKFLGSDYLLQALGYDPEKTLKRLGDAFYENQLIRDALRSQANTRFLGNATSDDAQMKRLMDNAVDASKSLQLRVGIALTPAQVAALTQDIVWLVEQVVEGQTVLVPQLYLASVDKNKLLPDGSLIAAGNTINLSADKGMSIAGTVSAGQQVQLTTQGDLTQNGKLFSFGNVVLDAAGAVTNNGSIQGNQIGILAGGNLDNLGSIKADTGIWLKAGDTLTNYSSGQMVSGGVLSLVSTNDLINKQGHLEGTDVFLKSENGNIINRTEFEQVATRYGTDTIIGNSSTIISRNSLVMDAGNNLDLQGSTFNAAGDISLKAGNDILLNAIENTRSSVTGGKTTFSQSTTTWNGVSINAGRNLELDAGRDLQAPGAQLTAGGDASLSAGRDINLLALANTHTEEMTAKRKHSIDTEVVNTLASVTAGGNARITAGQDANLIGAAVTAGDNVFLAATRDTNISAVLDSDYHYDYSKQKKSLGRSKTTENETLTQTATGGVINAGGNILVNSHVDSTGNLVTDTSGKVNLLGGSLKADGSVVVSADEDVNISGIAYDTLDFHRSAKSGLGGLSKKDKGAVETQTKLQNASITAGGDAHFLSGNNLTLAATNVMVDGNINLEAVDKLLITAGDVVSNSERWSKSTNIGSGGNLYGSKEHKSGESVTSGQASTLMAGGKVTGYVGSGEIIGSDITGAQGVKIVGDMGDITVGASRTTTQTYSHDKSMSVSVMDAVKGLTRPDQLIKNEDGRATLKLADAQYDQVDTKTTTTAMRGSTVNSNEDVSLIATAGNVTITGSTLTADADKNGSGTLGLAGATGVTIQEATDTYDTQTKEVHGSAELSIVVQHQAVEVAKAVVAVDEAKDKLEQAKKDYKAYERNVSQLEDQLSQLESDYANKVPGVNYDDLLELRNLVNDVKGDKEWYQAGVALAAVNLTSATTALVQQTAAAAQSAGTYGFNAGLQLDVDASKSNTTEKGTTAVASNLSGNNILIQTGTMGEDGKLNTQGTTTTISGSHLDATDKISILTGDLNLLASKDTHESQSEQEHGHVTAQMTVYGASGGASVSGSFDRSKNSDTSTTYNNTTLNANNIDLFTSGDANIRGANVHANEHLEVDIQGDLNLESVQNRSNSRNTSMGVSGGTSFGDKGNVSGVNAGISSGNGMSVTRETVLTSLTSGGTANVNVNGNTQITGALLGTVNADGSDRNQLNFSTGTLNFTDLRNISQNSQTNIGLSTNMSVGPAKAGNNPREGQTTAEGTNGNTLYANTSNLAYSNSQQNSASKTLATLGHGSISVGGTQLEQDGELTDAGRANGSPLIGMNRDTGNTEKTLWNSEQSQTVDATLDHRLLTADGRNQIKEDYKRTEIGVEAIGHLAEDSVSLTGKGEGETSLRQHMMDSQDYFTATKNFTNNPDNKAYIDAINSGIATPEQKDAAYTALANSIAQQMGVDPVKAMTLVQEHYNLNTALYEGTTINQQIQGAYAQDPLNQITGKKEGLIFLVDDNIANTADAVEAAGHEFSHHMDASRDPNATKTETYRDNRDNYADIMGSATVDYLNFNFASNGYSALGALNTRNGSSTNNATIQANNNTFNSIAPNQMDYRQLDVPEIKYVRDADRVERFADYIKATTGEDLTNKEAQARLLQGSAGLMDKEWQKIYGTDAKVMDFLMTEVANDINAVTNNNAAKSGEVTPALLQQQLMDSNLAYVDPRTGEKRLVFTLNEGEFANERQGVIEFAHTDKNVLGDLLVNKTNEQRYIDKQMGFTAGQADAISDPLGMLVNGVTGLVTALGSPIDTANGAWQGFKEAGSYESLLKLQGRDYELGYQEGQNQGNVALGAVGSPIMEALGSSLLQGALTRANGGSVNVTADVNGQATGLSMQTSTDVKWNNAVSNTDGDFGYLNQSPKTNSIFTSEIALENTGVKWGAGNNAQGLPWEARIIDDQNLLKPEAKNFATFDAFNFECGLGVSCKTMDLGTASKINNPNQIYNTLKGYIDKTANFEHERKLNLEVFEYQVPNRTIELAIPANPTPAQIEQLKRAQEYAKSRDITLKITKVKD